MYGFKGKSKPGGCRSSLYHRLLQTVNNRIFFSISFSTDELNSSILMFLHRFRYGGRVLEILASLAVCISCMRVLLLFKVESGDLAEVLKRIYIEILTCLVV